DGSTTYNPPFSSQIAVPVPLGGALIAGAAIDESNFVTAKINKSGGLELAAWALNASNEPTKWWGSAVLEELADNLCLAPLGDLAFEVIEDGSGTALILTGHLDDNSFQNIGDIAPVCLANGQFATTLGNDDGFGLVAYNLSDLSATLVRPLAEASDDQATAI